MIVQSSLSQKLKLKYLLIINYKLQYDVITLNFSRASIV